MTTIIAMTTWSHVVIYCICNPWKEPMDAQRKLSTVNKSYKSNNNSQQLRDIHGWYWRPSSPLWWPAEPGTASRLRAAVRPRPPELACSQSHSRSTHPSPERIKPQVNFQRHQQHVCVCVQWRAQAHTNLGVVVVRVGQGGEGRGRGKLGREHLSADGHSSLRPLHQRLQLVGGNVFGIDQQHHLGITQETRPHLQGQFDASIKRSPTILTRSDAMSSDSQDTGSLHDEGWISKIISSSLTRGIVGKGD